MPKSRLPGSDGAHEAPVLGNAGLSAERPSVSVEATSVPVVPPPNTVTPTGNGGALDRNRADFGDRLLVRDYFPGYATDVPFGSFLNGIFFEPISDNKDFPIHGPNVIRFVRALISNDLQTASGLLKGDESEAEATRGVFGVQYPAILDAMEVPWRANLVQERSRITDLLRIAALYHDIGKFIRRANHPQIGVNLIRNVDERERQKLVERLRYRDESDTSDSKHNRFSLIASLVQHHDKFGVVSTGEGALPIFSDILYFTSDATTLPGIKKNLTSVMLLNLADVAAVNVAKSAVREESLRLAKSIYELRKAHPKPDPQQEADLLQELLVLCRDPSSCLGLTLDKVRKILDDWSIVIRAVGHEVVQGNRAELKLHLMELERNPARAIQRVLRLIQEAAVTSNAGGLVDRRFVSPTSVESVLVGTLGAHQFQTFCQRLASVAKLDYGLAFFKAVTCACIRKELGLNVGVTLREAPPGQLTEDEADMLNGADDALKTRVAGKITMLFVRVLEGLITRYSGVLDVTSNNPRRFGFQMRDLTLDKRIRESIIDLLCVQDYKDPVALTWIADEVTVWSMD